MLIIYSPLRHQFLIHLRQHIQIPVPEHLVESSQSAPAVKGVEVQVVGGDAEGRGDVVLDQPQPLHLLVGEVHRAGVAAEAPLLVVGVHPVCEGGQLVGEAQQFAANVCKSINNSVDQDFADQKKREWEASLKEMEENN